MPTNHAAWLTSAKPLPLKVKSAPYTPPGPDEIVIRNHAVAINPADWIKQDMGTFMFSWIKYPFIIGTDVAGEVVEVGSQVTRFAVGDRVLGHAAAINQKRNRAAEGAFQQYVILEPHMTTPLPPSLSYEQASVIPLGASTAACGLFEPAQLGLDYPRTPQPKPTGKTVLIWGGSTSVGCNAIQLARAAGYDVITTASPRNFAYLKQLGASAVFDYASPRVVDDVVKAFDGRVSAGALSIGPGAADACMDVLHRCRGARVISMATYPVPSPPPKRFMLPQIMYAFISWSIANFFRSKLRGTRTAFIFASSLFDNGVGKAVYEDFLPGALAEGSFVAAPEPMVVGEGLEAIQKAMDRQKQGVSAKKVVVSL